MSGVSGGGGGGGWEEATGEFYQELYGGGDAEPAAALRGDAAAARLRTLLPSTRARRRTLRHADTLPPPPAPPAPPAPTHGRDHHLAMMPDLSEELSTEERTWDEVMLIKGLPLPMGEKRRLKRQLQSATRLRLVGAAALRWRRRLWWARARAAAGRLTRALTLWRRPLQRVQARAGAGVAAYFHLLRWLLLLNAAAAVTLLLLMPLPQLLLPRAPPACTAAAPLAPACCVDAYLNASSGALSLLELAQGTGRMERTLMFYGAYLERAGGDAFDTQLAYALAPALAALLALVAIVRSGAAHLRERLVDGEGQFYAYCNVVFGGWDFCIGSERAARTEHRAVHAELAGRLQRERRAQRRRQRTWRRWAAVVLGRALVNVAVVAMLVGAAGGIYAALEYSQRRLAADEGSRSELMAALLQFLPFVVIAALNGTLPEVFTALGRLEGLEPAGAALALMVRCVLLRLASLAALLWQLRSAAITGEHLQCAAAAAITDSRRYCWETFAGQQLYRLVLSEWALQLGLLVLVQWPRALLARACAARWLRPAPFQLPRNALDAVNAQCVVWLGAPFCPPLPALHAVLLVSTFYSKRFALWHVHPPAPVLYRSARVRGALMALLLLALALALAPLAYWAAEGAPSRSCGLFGASGLSVWASLRQRVGALVPPLVVRAAVVLRSDAALALAGALLLAALYYYWAVCAANRALVRALRRQLALEGRDKQFLLRRLAATIRHQHHPQHHE